jgi:DNA-binding NtrC family response regulator
MVGRSRALQEIYDLIVRVAPTDASVLISGESGTGKELVAETIHRISPRRNRPFVVVNCGAISSNLMESELFGHERGSFTGADKQRIGCFERASGGTLFLDEVTEMPVDLQVKLLRVLENGTVVRVGGSELIHVDVRVLSATNREPDKAVSSGKLREDLYYRLNVFPIVVPPLRDRPEDITLLAEHFLAGLNRTTDSKKRWTLPALECLLRIPWLGNVRELKNVVHRAFILGGDEIGIEDLPFAQMAPRTVGANAVLDLAPGISLAAAERCLILATLEMQHGDKRKAAEILGISLKTLYNRLNVYTGGDRHLLPARTS